MRIPQQVSDRVKEAPAQALRAVFAGIGQVLLVADRIKSRAAEANRARSTTVAPPARPASNGAAPMPDTTVPDKTVPDKTRWRSLDETGNVRLLSDNDAPDDEPVTAATEPGTAAEPPAAEPASAEPVMAEPAADEVWPAAEPPAAESPAAEAPPAAAESLAAEPSAAEPSAAAEPPAVEAVLPVPNYDGLTVASLRARLRNLDPPQLRVLIDYEKAHAGRADVLTMFERRIAKLESGEA